MLYGKIAKLGAQVKRLTDQVKPDQIKFIYFDEFVNKTDKIYCSVLEFLKVRKKYWLIPIVIVLVLFGGLIVLSQGSAIAPFIYTIF